MARSFHVPRMALRTTRVVATVADQLTWQAPAANGGQYDSPHVLEPLNVTVQAFGLGSPIAGRSVTFTIAGAGNTCTPAVVVTDANGYASTDLATTGVGYWSVTATCDGISASFTYHAT